MRALAITVLWLGVAHATIASEESFKVIVNPDNPVAAIDREFLRDAYLKKAADWNHGETVRPIDLSTRFSVRERFVADVLKKSTSQLKNYWNQQIFSGKSVPPPEAGSTADAVSYVLEHRGGVGYLPLDADPGHAKVVRIK
jgi:hypothetical protein